MTLQTRSPAPAGRPGTGRVENELAGSFLNLPNISDLAPGEAFAAAWLARRGIRPAIAPTVAALASIGGEL